MAAGQPNAAVPPSPAQQQQQQQAVAAAAAAQQQQHHALAAAAAAAMARNPAMSQVHMNQVSLALKQQQQQQLQQLQAQQQRTGMVLKPGLGRPMLPMGGASAGQQYQQHQQHLQQQQQQQQQARVFSAEATPAAKRRKRRAADKQIPERVAALLPESALYTQLLEFESRVDSALERKRLEIQETVANPPRYQRTLRMYVFNTFANQPGSHDPQAGYNPGEPPSWTLRIMGRVLGDEGDTEAKGSSSSSASASASAGFPKFSTFFRRITVTLDPALYKENNTIVWEAARATAPVEGFEIKRQGEHEFTATIRLEMRYTPERYKLSPPLAELLGVEVETRARIIAAFWHYVKGKKLQSPGDPTVVHCDPALQRILGEERVKFTSITQRLQQHLSTPQPIQLDYRVRLSGKSPVGNACYDISVDVATSLQKEMSAFLASVDRHRDVEAYDELISGAIRKINEHRKRRAFFLGFSHSPVEFINGLIASQSRDLKIVSGQSSRSADKERRSDFYGQPWVEDAAMRYLNRRTRLQDGGTPAANP